MDTPSPLEHKRYSNDANVSESTQYSSPEFRFENSSIADKSLYIELSPIPTGQQQLIIEQSHQTYRYTGYDSEEDATESISSIDTTDLVNYRAGKQNRDSSPILEDSDSLICVDHGNKILLNNTSVKDSTNSPISSVSSKLEEMKRVADSMHSRSLIMSTRRNLDVNNILSSLNQKKDQKIEKPQDISDNDETSKLLERYLQKYRSKGKCDVRVDTEAQANQLFVEEVTEDKPPEKTNRTAESNIVEQASYNENENAIPMEADISSYSSQNSGLESYSNLKGRHSVSSLTSTESTNPNVISKKSRYHWINLSNDSLMAELDTLYSFTQEISGGTSLQDLNTTMSFPKERWRMVEPFPENDINYHITRYRNKESLHAEDSRMISIDSTQMSTETTALIHAKIGKFAERSQKTFPIQRMIRKNGIVSRPKAAMVAASYGQQGTYDQYHKTILGDAKHNPMSYRYQHVGSKMPLDSSFSSEESTYMSDDTLSTFMTSVRCPFSDTSDFVQKYRHQHLKRIQMERLYHEINRALMHPAIKNFRSRSSFSDDSDDDNKAEEDHNKAWQISETRKKNVPRTEMRKGRSQSVPRTFRKARTKSQMTSKKKNKRKETNGSHAIFKDKRNCSRSAKLSFDMSEVTSSTSEFSHTSGFSDNSFLWEDETATTSIMTDDSFYHRERTLPQTTVAHIRREMFELNHPNSQPSQMQRKNISPLRRRTSSRDMRWGSPRRAPTNLSQQQQQPCHSYNSNLYQIRPLHPMQQQVQSQRDHTNRVQQPNSKLGDSGPHGTQKQDPSQTAQRVPLPIPNGSGAITRQVTKKKQPNRLGDSLRTPQPSPAAYQKTAFDTLDPSYIVASSLSHHPSSATTKIQAQFDYSTPSSCFSDRPLSTPDNGSFTSTLSKDISDWQKSKRMNVSHEVVQHHTSTLSGSSSIKSEGPLPLETPKTKVPKSPSLPSEIHEPNSIEFEPNSFSHNSEENSRNMVQIELGESAPKISLSVGSYKTLELRVHPNSGRNRSSKHSDITADITRDSSHSIAYISSATDSITQGPTSEQTTNMSANKSHSQILESSIRTSVSSANSEQLYGESMDVHKIMYDSYLLNMTESADDQAAPLKQDIFLDNLLLSSDHCHHQQQLQTVSIQEEERPVVESLQPLRELFTQYFERRHSQHEFQVITLRSSEPE